MRMNYVIYCMCFMMLSWTMFSCSSSEDITEPTIVQPTPSNPTTGSENDNDSDSTNDTDMGDFDDSDYPEAPNFVSKTTDDLELKLSSYEGKNLVIFFFGSACPPCRAIAPSIESDIHQAFKNNQDFAIIGLDEWDLSDRNVDAFQSTTQVTFDLGTMGGDIAREYETRFDRLVVISKNNKIIYRENKVASRSLDEVVDLLNQLLEK